jgi:hypothetical protein
MLSRYAPESDIINVLHLGRFIVSKSPSETTDCPQTFIVKMLIIENIHNRHIYMKQKEGASELASGETERECVRVRR